MENQQKHRAIILEALRKARDQAIRENKALGLEYLIVKDGKVFMVLPDGEKRYVKEAEFGSRTTEKKQFELRAD